MIARNTAFTYKGKPVDARQLGRELGVRFTWSKAAFGVAASRSG